MTRLITLHLIKPDLMIPNLSCLAPNAWPYDFIPSNPRPYETRPETWFNQQETHPILCSDFPVASISCAFDPRDAISLRDLTDLGICQVSNRSHPHHTHCRHPSPTTSKPNPNPHPNPNPDVNRIRFRIRNRIRVAGSPWCWWLLFFFEGLFVFIGRWFWMQKTERI